jgi:hypothetical protein
MTEQWEDRLALIASGEWSEVTPGMAREALRELAELRGFVRASVDASEAEQAGADERHRELLVELREIARCVRGMHDRALRIPEDSQ